MLRPLMAAAMLLAAGAAAPPAAVPPPVLRMPDMPLHDLWIVADRATGTYRLFTRNEQPMTGDGRVGIMVYASHDLKRWTKPRVVFALPRDSWTNDGV